MARQMRRMEKLGSVEAKGIVSSMIGHRLETYDASEMVHGFEVLMHRLYGRAPTDGEVDLFHKEFGKVTDALIRKADKAEVAIEQKADKVATKKKLTKVAKKTARKTRARKPRA